MNSRPTAIEALAADPSGGGLVLDFDGVLSPIVDDPSASAMPDRAGCWACLPSYRAGQPNSSKTVSGFPG